MKLKDKAAIVTGSGRGIGEQIALKYDREARRSLSPTSTRARASAVSERLGALGAQALPLRVDVSDPRDVDTMVDRTVQEFGRLDILVNNAGVGTATRLIDMPLEDWERVLKVNLTGTFLCTKAAILAMLEQAAGAIVNIASLSGQRGGTGRAAYGASKAGVELLTRVTAVEYADSGIRANAIAPGAIETEMAAQVHSEATRKAYHYLIPQKRYGTPEEIADAAVFLASDEAAYINGVTLNVDGGFRAAGLMFETPERIP